MNNQYLIKVVLGVCMDGCERVRGRGRGRGRGQQRQQGQNQ